MNIPEFYLIEPYNAYTSPKDGKKKEKHLCHILEEQALLEQILREANTVNKSNNNTNNNTSNTTTVTSANIAATAGAGAGYDHLSIVRSDFQIALLNSGSNQTFTNSITSSLTGSLSSSLLIGFKNLSTNNDPRFPVSYKWSFGDGTISYSPNPSNKTYKTGSFSIKLEASSSHGLAFSDSVTKLALSCSL